MGDEQNGFPLRRQILHNLHQLIDLLRSQHGCGLVEDKDLVVTVQHFQYFHPLLHTHGDVLHQGIHIHAQAVPLRQLLHLFSGFLLLHKTHPGGLCTQDNIVHHGENIHQLKVLVYHSDPQSGRRIGIGDVHPHSIFADFARFRLIQAEQHTH